MSRAITVLFCTILGLTSSLADCFNSYDVCILNNRDSVELAGTLSVPRDNTPRAALVFASGSGLQNRNGNLAGGSEPFRVLSDTLATHGFAVLRIDDRGTGGSGGDGELADIDDEISDIQACISMLDSCFNKSVSIGILGHSQGGYAAVKLAATNSGCDFIITFGAPAWDGDSVIMSQTRNMAINEHGSYPCENADRRIMQLLKSDMPEGVLYDEAMKIMEEDYHIDNPRADRITAEKVRYMVFPPFRSVVKMKPSRYISKVTQPWLAINGDKDTQVLPDQLQLISEWNPQAQTVLLKGINHQMQNCATGEIAEYKTLTEDISPAVITAIVSWLDKIFPITE